MKKIILILGASYVGLAVTHCLLKNVLKDKGKEYKVVLVCPSSHHYWNMASVRAIIPGQIPDKRLFASISDGLEKYGDSVEFVIGIATKLDITSKSVTISTKDGERDQTYEILIIATGSRAKEDIVLPWYSSTSGYEATRDTLHKYQEAVKNAKTIVIGGGGPTGVELAGEVGFEFGKNKEITLITAGSKLLTTGTPAMSTTADSELRKFDINIIYNTKIIESTSSETGKTTLALSNGKTKTVDLYLPTVGSAPNTNFIPKNYLDEENYLIVDEFFRVKNLPDAWAAGDVTALEPSQYVYAKKQINALVRNLDLKIHGKELVAYKRGPPIFGVTLGRSNATGRLGPINLPSIVLWFAKGRTLGTENLKPLVSGSKF